MAIALLSENSEESRVLKAVSINRKSSENLLSEAFNREKLRQFISSTNDRSILPSGNCAVLAVSFLYNVCHETHYLSIGSTHPRWVGFNIDTPARIILGQDLITDGKDYNNLDELEKSILNCYFRTGERVFVVNAEYDIPILHAGGHALNAMVFLDKETNKPFVQFIDAWRAASNNMPSKDEIRKRYDKDTVFSFCYCENKALLGNFIANFSHRVKQNNQSSYVKFCVASSKSSSLVTFHIPTNIKDSSGEEESARQLVRR